MRARSLSLFTSIVVGTVAGLCLLALAPAIPSGPGGGALLGQRGLTLGPADAEAILRRRIITPEFDSRLGLRVGGRDISVSGPLSCNQGNAWRIDVDVTQGSSRERARTAGMCTGTVQEWRARVAGSGPGTFKPGSARGCAHLVATDDRGRVTRRRRWCRDVTLVSETAPAAAAKEEEDSDTLSVVALVLAALALLFGAVTFALARRRT